jgi:broad specificity phosphatase PhoE
VTHRYVGAVLLLVRHGETAANRLGHLLGRADPELSPHGRQQAAALAAWLPRADLVVTSPLRRARQTAEALAADVVVDERWIELDYGPYDDRPPAAMPADVWARWRTDPSFTPPGVEPLSALGARVGAACAELSPRAESAVVVVVTHVSPVKAALAWALGVPDGIAWRLFVEDAGVSRIDIDDRGPVVRWFNRLG